MRFADIIGQQELKEKLVGMARRDRVAHATMFLGPEGAGSFALALALAQFISCSNPEETDSCGACPSCLKFRTCQHPDLHFSYPIINPGTSIKKTSEFFNAQWREMILKSPYFNFHEWRNYIRAENKQLGIFVDEANSILHKLSLSSYEGGSRFLIMWLPELMRPDTANKLLKILEEPEPGTLFILVSESTETILPTILSRTQLVKVNKIKDAPMTAALVEKLKLDEEVAQDLTHFVDGNFVKARELAETNDESAHFFAAFVSWMRACYSRDVVQMVVLADEIHSKGREGAKEFLEYTLHFVRQCIVHNYGQDDLARFTAQEAAFAQKFSPFINHLNVIEISREVNEAITDIAGNVYLKTVLVDLSLKIHRLLRRQD
jgi:DNA polymerase III subunit delta'